MTVFVQFLFCCELNKLKHLLFNALFCYGFIFKFYNFEISLKIFNNKRRSWKILDLLFCNLQKFFSKIISEKRRKQKKYQKSLQKLKNCFVKKFFDISRILFPEMLHKFDVILNEKLTNCFVKKVKNKNDDFFSLFLKNF